MRKLTAYLDSVSRTPFKPGKHDCALFCAGAVQAMTGFDAARGWRGYKTLKAGQKKLAAKGFQNWWDMLADREIAADKVRVGDIALIQAGDDLAGGICIGPRVAVVRAEGRANAPYSAIVKGYRI